MTATDATAIVPGQSRAVRIAVTVATAALTLSCIGWALQAYQWFGFAFFPEQLLAFVLAMSVFAGFLQLRSDRRQGGEVPWYDWLCAVAGLLVLCWICVNYERLLFDAGQATMEMTALGIATVVLTLEVLRRAAGYMLFGVVIFFILYAFVGDLMPGRLRTLPVAFNELFVFLGIDATATFGTPLKISAEVVVVFVFLGQLLVRAGGGEFFTDLALAMMGRRRGGAAKVAVAASAMFGSISGSATSNVASTGIITIPLMRRSGYSGEDAGAIEATASTGGSLMPPVMGAAAFLMAEYLQISYAEVVIAAIVPALLYYFAVYVQVDLLAAKDRILPVKADLPKTRDVLSQGWHFLVPFAALLIALFEFWVEPQEAALWAAAAVVVMGSIFQYKNQRLTLATFFGSFSGSGQILVELILIVAAAGMIIGILSLTGLSFALTFALVKLGGGSLFLLLIIAAATCIILGFGMPATGVYVLLASLVAPALVKAGVVPISAHMFIFYFGLMSALTPPVAICSFTAAAISGADAMRTGIASMKFAWTAYIVPFLFVLSPTLLLRGDSWAIVFNVVLAMVGVYLISTAVIGHFSRAMSKSIRFLLAIAGFAALVPGTAMRGGEFIDFAGVVVGSAILVRQYVLSRRHPTL